MPTVTLKELAAEQTKLRQEMNGFAATLDLFRKEFNEHKLAVHNEVKQYFESGLRTESSYRPDDTPSGRKGQKPDASRRLSVPENERTRTEPWRIPQDEFLNWKDSVVQDWHEDGNARVGQRLARALGRNSGHAEGQLYIDWCDKVGREAVRAFWQGRGFRQVPDGL